jgi:hypothetical protein
MAQSLNDKLSTALQEFRREKKLRQNARLSLSEIPIRKQLLVKGLANFRAPLERSKSAPKLTSIVEDITEDVEDITEENDFDQESIVDDESLPSDEVIYATNGST